MERLTSRTPRPHSRPLVEPPSNPVRFTRDNIVNFRPTHHSPLTPVEAALIHLGNAVPAFGVVVDTEARLGVVYDGGETAKFINLDDGEDSFGIAVPPAAAERLQTSDASEYGLAEQLATPWRTCLR